MATTTDLIQQLYVAYFNRPADVAGLAFWVNAVDNQGVSIDTVSKNFNTAAEYTSAYAGKSADAIVNTVYQNLFGRTADSAGLNFWGPKIASGAISTADLVKAITAGALNPDGTPNADGAVFNNKVAAAEAFTTEIGTAGNEAERVAYSSGTAAVLTAAKAFIAGVTTDASLATAVAGVHAAAQALLPTPPVTTTALTAGVDTLVGGAGNDTFNATGSTLSALDSIDGGAGSNNLVIADAAGVLGGTVPAGVVVKNIQGLSVNTAGGLGTVGVTGTPATAQINNYAFTAAAGADTVVVNYGNLSTTMNLTATAATNATNFIAAINALAGATIATAGAGTSVNVTAPVAGTALPGISFSSFSVAGDAATITSTTPTPNAAAVGGSTNAVYDVSGFSGLTSVTASVAGSVNLKVAETTAVTVTNSANSAVTVTGGVSANVTTGTGAVVIAGNAGGLTTATVVGGTTVDVQTNASGTLVDKLTSVSVDSNTGAVTVQSDALTSLSVANGGSNATVTAAAGTRALALTVNGLTGGTISDATATTVNVKSTTASSTGVTLGAAAATAVTIAGDKALTLSSLNGAAETSLAVSNAALTTINGFGTTNKLATITVTGAGGLKANVSGQTVLTTVDASGSSGANSITLNAAQTAYKGGSGVDTVTVSVAPTVVIDGGAGTNDVIIENAATDILTGNTKITGFETLGLGTATTGNYDATGFAHLSIAGTTFAGVTFTNVAAGTDLAVSGSTGQTIGYSLFNSTGSNDVLTAKFSASAAAANNLTATGIETVNIAVADTNTTANHAAFVETLTLSAANASKVVVTGNGSLGLTLIDTDTALTSVDASGLTVAGTGAANSGFVWTTGNLAAAATIKGSVNGGDTINASATTLKALTITVNGGTNSVTGGGVADTITAGNGSNTINGGAGNDIITVGSGANSITGGTGADLITLATHAGKVDTIFQNTGDTGANTALNTQTSVLTSSFDVVKGIVAGDKLDLTGIAGITYATANLTFNAANLAAADGKVVFASGTFDATNGVFNYGASGADTLVTYDTDATGAVAGQSIVLVGYHASATATVAAAGVVTLG